MQSPHRRTPWLLAIFVVVAANAGFGQATSLLLTQSGMAFSGVEGGASVAPQAVGILNMGQGTMPWSAQASTLSGGNWLGVSPSTGTSEGGSSTIVRAQVSVSLVGLRAGAYQGIVQVTASGADQSPQSISVQLTVSAPGSTLGPQLEPKNLIFAAGSGGSSPSAQTVRVTGGGSGSVQVRAAAITFDGDPWLSFAPQSSFNLSPGAPAELTIQPQLGSLSARVYRAALTINFPDGSSPPTADVFFLITPPAGGVPSGRPCVPQRLVVVLLNNFANSSLPVGWPVSISARVADDCGNVVPEATVVCSFSNGENPIVLGSRRDGSYNATYVLKSAGTVTLTIRASTPLFLGETSGQIVGAVATGVPVVSSGGIVNGASFAPNTALAPGMIVSIFGRGLAAFQATAAGLPLPTTLGGTSVFVGAQDAPIFFASEAQVNLQLPFELAPNTNTQLLVRVGNTFSTSESLTIANFWPGIFTISGPGQGAVQIANTATFAAPVGSVPGSSARPVNRGEFITIYCSGLGATQPAVGTGNATPVLPLARVVTPVEVVIGGKTAQAAFAGLAPGFVSLYQVNVQVPNDVTVGSAVSLVIRQGNISSNSVTVAVQ